MPLTVKQLEKLRTRGRYLDEHGLYLQVRPPGGKSWLLRYERFGRERWMGLGSCADFTLAEARERARRARQMLQDKIDPLEEKQAQKRAAQADQRHIQARRKTFASVVTEYYEHHNLKWRNEKHRAQFLSTLKQYAYPVIGELPVADVDRTLVLKVLDPVWKLKPETAGRVRGRIETVLNFAAVRGYRSGENPARWKGHLDQVLLAKTHIRKVIHHRALPYAELPAFMASLKGRKGTAARAVEFLIFTASRTSEVTGALWEEFDLENATWTVPAARMKAKREHRVPLSGPALAVLAGLPREVGNPFVFVGPRRNGLSNMAMDTVLKRMDYKNKATIHGFRSCFRDWTAERTNYQNHIAEAALAHVIGDKVEAAYRRGDLFDKRRKMMTDWARFSGPSEAVIGKIAIIRAA
jgi:integrase